MYTLEYFCIVNELFIIFYPYLYESFVYFLDEYFLLRKFCIEKKKQNKPSFFIQWELIFLFPNSPVLK